MTYKREKLFNLLVIFLIVLLIILLSISLLSDILQLSSQMQNTFAAGAFVFFGLLVLQLMMRIPLEKINLPFLNFKNKPVYQSSGLKDLQFGKDFKLQLALDEGFYFYYPSDWELIRPVNSSQYAVIKKIEKIGNADFYRNFNIICQNIAGVKDTNLIFEKIVDGALSAFNNAQLDFKEKVNSKKLLGVKYKIDYKNTYGYAMCCYQLTLTSPLKRKLLIITFTTLQNDFSQSKELFDRIVDGFKIVD